MKGWIKVSRRLLDWQWHDEPNMVALWVHILLRACHETTRYHGMTVKRGQLATSLSKLASATGISRASVRTCLRRLVDEQSIRISSGGVCTIVTVENYDAYQIGTDEPRTSRTPTRTEVARQTTDITQCDSERYDTYTDAGSHGSSTPTRTDAARQRTHNAHANAHGSSTETRTEVARQTTEATQCDSERYDTYTDVGSHGSSTPTHTDAARYEARMPHTDGHAYNKNSNISSSPYACADVREGSITPDAAMTTMAAVLNDAAYAPLILLRSKMSPADIMRYVPEFAAQRMGRPWRNIRDFVEHAANWLQKKHQYDTPQHPTTSGDAGAAEAERHASVVETAYGLMAGSRRDD